MKLVLVLMVFVFSLNFVLGNERVILKSGKIIVGNVTEEGDKVILKTKYGVITYKKEDVTVKRISEIGSKIKDVSDHSVKSKTEVKEKFIPYLITTKSGRKIRGDIIEKNGKLFLHELGGVVELDEFVIAKKEIIGQNKIQGDVISGERCNVLLKSGRAFSGIVEEKDDYILVTSKIGAVRLDRKYLLSYERTGYLLDLRKKKRSAKKSNNSNVAKTKTSAGSSSVTGRPMITSKDEFSNIKEERDEKFKKMMGKVKKKKGLIKSLYEVY